MLDFARPIRVPSQVLMRELGEESVLLHLGTETYFGLDETGTRFWRALTRQPSLGAALEELTRTYRADPDELRCDLAALVKELVSHGLLQLDRS